MTTRATTHILRLGLAALGLASCLGAAHAEGHYVPGVEGVEAASAPPPGFYYEAYLVDYRIHDVRVPGSSSTLPGSNRGSVTAMANRFVWFTGRKLLGADYGLEAIVPVVHTSLKFDAAGIHESHTGLGDIFLGPLILSWHGARWDAVAGAGLWLDNARSSAPSDPGKGFKSWMVSGGGTYYFDETKTFSASVLARWERNGRNGQGVRNGNQLSLEWGVGKSFGLMQAGLVGYSQWQLTQDDGPAVSPDKSSRHALGAEVSYAFPPQKMKLKLAFYKEVDAKAGTNPLPAGTLLRFTLLKAF